MSSDLFAADYHAAALVTAIVAAHADVIIATNVPQSAAATAKALIDQRIPRAALRHITSLLLPHGNIWLRDYSPIVAATDGGTPPHFFHFRYADPASNLNDGFAAVLSTALGVPVTNFPASLDGGNFLTNGDFCFTSATDLPITTEAKPERFFAQFGCRDTTVFQGAPHAHIDMWMKIASKNQVLVNDLDAKTLEVATRRYGHLPPELVNLRDALNQKADELSRMMQVIRIPMPLPYRGTFRTYTNAALFNHHAIIPSFDRFGWNYDDYPDAALKADYERRVGAIYRSLGFTPHWISADGLIYNGGAFHCVTATVPVFGSLHSTHADEHDLRTPNSDQGSGRKGH